MRPVFLASLADMNERMMRLPGAHSAAFITAFDGSTKEKNGLFGKVKGEAYGSWGKRVGCMAVRKKVWHMIVEGNCAHTWR